MDTIISNLHRFTDQCKLELDNWRFASAPGGRETLYASCFACMLDHYTGRLDEYSSSQKVDWASYLTSWQDPHTGYFLGPELVAEEIHSKNHSYEHISQHLTAHVLPALSLLGASPTFPLSFAHPFTELDYLRDWLDKRDWRDAWLEGNNLLFVGQFLIFLRDVEGITSARPALDLYFEWLNQEVDPATGLWGSNGYCTNAVALYGGYHQLLTYYHEDQPVQYPERLVDVALSLQHKDGGFYRGGGGGACEDADAVDILVNMYKFTDYKRPQIRIALRRTLRHIEKLQMQDGGFVYRLNQPFIHMGIEKTASPPNQSNLFPTWFRTHTIALISEILTDEPLARVNWRFNNSFSMGWHRPWNKEVHKITWLDKQAERLVQARVQTSQAVRRLPESSRQVMGKMKRRILRKIGDA